MSVFELSSSQNGALLVFDSCLAILYTHVFLDRPFAPLWPYYLLALIAHKSIRGCHTPICLYVWDQRRIVLHSVVRPCCRVTSLTHHSIALSQFASKTLFLRYALAYFHSHTALQNLPVRCLERHWTARTNAICFPKVLPSHINTLGYLRLRQTTALSQHPQMKAELLSHTPRKINEFHYMF